MTDQAQLSTAWLRQACHTRRKVNVGWWLARAMPLLVVAGVLGFAVIFVLRSRGMELGWSQVWPWVASVFAALMLTGWLLARRQFISSSQALVRLESELQLHNALTTAAASRGVWPALVAKVDDGWRWRWRAVGGPVISFAASLALAVWLPVAQDVEAKGPTVEPQAWAQMEDWLEKLKEDKIVTEEEKEEQLAKIAELRNQPPEKWFSHESLNAGDTLKEQLQRDIKQMAQNLSTAERSLNALKNYADQLSVEAKEQLLKDFDQALADMKSSALELDPELLKSIAALDPKNLKGLTQEQMKQLSESMKKKAGSCNGMCKNPGFLGDGEGEDDELADLLKKNGQGQGDGEGPGNGGITRGPGTAPLTLSDEENNFGTNKNEAVSNTDLSRAQVGDMLALQNGRHGVDKSAKGPQAAGVVQDAGQGGEQVWRESLTPEEKAVLKRVFR
ncbi:hypothetical protein [Prosthecobacter sp.]|uniref:hypothetical protein n=1 Tax=Prosthecobacter sp. TaxID=1965333 RepID=UPI002487A129|nr:hypothetical protein [Prosthecobacter sp.]MDI1310632.1 hypothetical protein [Prosthecobacter sp.]